MKILIVDDERFNLVIARDIIEAYVENDGVVLCNFPEQVMPLLKQQDIDIVLLDIVMPGTNGIDILKEIRRHDEYKDVPVIMFTGITDKESFRVCFENGATDYISKPIDITEFTARMRAAVRTRKNTLVLKQTFDKIADQYSELQKVTQKLKETQFYLLQQEKLAALGEIAAGVAHEINNPIGFVGSNLETMEKYLAKIKDMLAAYRSFAGLVAAENSSRQDLLKEKERIDKTEKILKMDFLLADLEPMISESKDGIERIAKIVRSLRNFARTGSEDDMVMNDLNQIVEEALLLVRNEVKYAAHVEKKLNLLPAVICDKSQIAQVLMNIFINAAQAIKNQSSDSLGNISVKTYLDGSYVICKITDDGPGIQAKQLGRIFDPFFTTKDVGNGAGLGLSIAYGIIKNHGGELLAESEYGKGASVSVKLPIPGN